MAFILTPMHDEPGTFVEPPPELRLGFGSRVEIEPSHVQVSLGSSTMLGALGISVSVDANGVSETPNNTIVFQFEFRCLGGLSRQRPVGAWPT